MKRLIVPFHEIVRQIRSLRPPVIAAAHGAVAGCGLALALACDFVIASADAVFTPAYLKIATTLSVRRPCAPSTTALRAAVPLPRYAGQEKKDFPPMRACKAKRGRWQTAQAG